MKYIERCLGVVVAVALLATACTSSSDTSDTTAADATPEAVASESAPATPEPVEPTPTAAVVVASDQARIDAALSAYTEAPMPEGIAYDLIETSVRGEFVDIRVCGWRSDTVYDRVYVSTYLTEVDDSGQVTASHTQSNATVNDCHNTQLATSAREFINSYDEYWSRVAADPATYDTNEGLRYFTPVLEDARQSQVLKWEQDGLFVRGLPAGLNEEDLSQPLVVRTYNDNNDLEVLEILACRPMPADFGLYRADGLLVDRFQTELETVGPHSVLRYFLTRTDDDWRLAGTEGLDWADCSPFTDNWIETVNEIYPEPAQWDDF